MISNYLTILEDSLKQKSVILEQIAEVSTKQEELLREETLALEEFDSYVDKKDEFIQKLSQLDDGFESLYDKIREELLANKDRYKQQISEIKQLIAQITEKSVSIQAQEARNQQKVQQYFANERSQLKKGRTASKAAYGYYKNMSNQGMVPPQFMDQKK